MHVCVYVREVQVVRRKMMQKSAWVSVIYVDLFATTSVIRLPHLDLLQPNEIFTTFLEFTAQTTQQPTTQRTAIHTSTVHVGLAS